MIGALVAPPSANVAPNAVPAWQGAAATSGYPVTNLLTLEPDRVARTDTGGLVALRLTFPTPVRLEGFALINTNFSGLTVTITNSGGMAAQARVVAATEDGLGLNVWWDFRGLAGTTAQVWDITVTKPGSLIIGTVLALTSWTQLRVRWEWELTDVFPRIEQRTGYGKRLQYWIPVRTRRYTAVALAAEQRDLLRRIKREAHGSIVPWPLVPDAHDHAVVYVQFVPEELTETYRTGTGRFDTGTARGVVDMPVELEEVSNGVAL